MEWPNW